MKRIMKILKGVPALLTAGVLAASCAAPCLGHVTAMAEEALTETLSGTYENLSWSIENGVLTISGEGEMYQNGALTSGSSYPWYNKSFSSVVIEEGVTSIGDYAFSRFTKLENMHIANSVETIGIYAFYMSNVQSVEIPEGVIAIEKSAFSSTDITSIVLPESIVSLGTDVFASCTALQYAEIKTDIAVLPTRTFYNCTSLSECILPDTLTEIRNEAFANSGIADITLPDSILKIGAKAFDTAVTMNAVILPDSVTAVQDNSFTNITSITLGADTVVKTANIAIGNTSLINSTYIKNSKRLDDIFVSPENPHYTAEDGILYDKGKTCILDFAPTHVFENDTYVLPDTLESVYAGREPITHINIRNFAVSQENEYFSTIDGVLVSKDGKTLVLYPHVREDMIYTVPDGIEVIGEYAFYKSKVSHVILSDTVVSVEKVAFKQSEIKRFDAAPGLSYIGNSAFSYCNILYMELPVLSGTAGAEAFNINTMTALHLPANSEFDLGDNMVMVIYGDETNGEVTASGTHGSFNWEISNSTLCITGSGEMDTCEYDEYPWYGLDFYLLKFSGENISIPDRAFYNAKKLCAAELEGVVSIGTEAFKGCSSLVKVTEGDSIEYVSDHTFLSTSWLTTPVHHYRNDETAGLCILGSVILYCDENAESVCIPERITYIARDAFNFCLDLNTLYITETGFECPINTFSYCTRIEHLRFIDSSKDITLNDLQEMCLGLEKADLTGEAGETAEGKLIYSTDVILNIINMLENTVYVSNLCEEYCRNIIAETGCNADMTDEELIRAFHNHLMDTTSYGFTYTEDLNGTHEADGRMWSMNTLFSHKAAGLSIVKSGVCSSYMEIFMCYVSVLAEDNISTTLRAAECRGDNHTWNAIGLDTGTENERWYYHDTSNGQCLIGYENPILKNNPEMFAYDGSVPENEDGTYTVTLYDGSTVKIQAADAEANRIKGDADGNEIVDISDAVLVLKIYAQNAAGIAPDAGDSDVDGNGVTEIGDATAILMYYARNAAGIHTSWDDLMEELFSD